MNAPKNLCHKCPHFYEDDGDWGCMLFGPEAERCHSMHNDDDLDITEIGCDIGKRQLNFLAHRRNKNFELWNKKGYLDFKRRKPYTSKEKDNYGYKAYFHDEGITDFCMPYYRENMKGGHTNNHIYNVLYRCDFVRSGEQQKTKKERHDIYERNRRKATAPDHCWNCIEFTECSMSESRNCERWRLDK